MKLIELSETHYIVVDDSEIKEGSWVINGNSKIFQYTKESISGINYCKKITHSTEQIERYDHPAGGYEGTFDKIKPLSLSEVEEAINEYSVEKMAEENGNNYAHSYNPDIFIEGFKAHQELVKDKLFTEIDKQIADFKHDLRESTSTYVKLNCEGALFGLKRLKQSLLPKTEWDVEFDEQGKLRLI